MHLFFSPARFFPSISDATQAFIRAAYGLLLFGTLLQAMPQARRFFVSERWRGYAKSSPAVDAVQNPIVMPLIVGIWSLTAILLIVGRWTLVAAGINLIFAHYYCVQMRWKSVVRGLGAPGLMTYWLGFAIFLLELTVRVGPGVRDLALLVLQVDFSFIILSAGVYKFTAGYAHNQGMELGMVNPEWGYWWRFYRTLRPSHWLFHTLNHLAWGTEVAAALLMLVPPTRFLGGLLIILSFAFIATQIRLGLLCEMVMICGLLFVHPGSLVDGWLMRIMHAAPLASRSMPLLSGVVGTLLWAYLVLLPLAHAGMYYNFYARKRLPAPLQRAVERYTNFFGMIIWRVFSVDVVNFFVTIDRLDGATGERAAISSWGNPLRLRYNHVVESITVTSLFTTLKYYPSNTALFRERVLRYARTLPPDGAALVFNYFSVTKNAGDFSFTPVAEYHVDAARTAVDERLINAAISVYVPNAASPVHEGAVPGSYAPLAS